jgi:hypothetical protein
MAAPLTVPIAHAPLVVGDKQQPAVTERVAEILIRCKASLIADWLKQTKKAPELNHLHLSDEQRTGHLPKLVDDLVVRLGKAVTPNKNSDASMSPAAINHGNLRRTQGYSAGMLIHESRILQVTIFGTLQQNISVLDFNLLLPNVMIIADEVDSQLTQTMESFTNAAPTNVATKLGPSKSAKTQLVKPKG